MSKKRKKILEPIELDINKLSQEGRGLAEYQGKKVFVLNALPGEKVLAKVYKQNSRYFEAKTQQVLSASSSRIAAICPHFGECGGCQLQHLSSHDQIKIKQQALEQSLSHLNITPLNWAAPLRGESRGYRFKARLGVRVVPQKGGTLVGFRECHSNKIVEMSSCEVLHPRVGQNIEGLKQLIDSLAIKSHIPQIEVSAGDQEVALVFRHLEDFPESDLLKIQSFCEQHQLSFYCQPKGPDTVHKIWPQNSESLQYHLKDNQVSIDFHPLDFTQVNPVMNQKMITQALDWLQLTDQDNVLDLFCGLGNFTLPMARLANSVVGVEGETRMVEKAKHNAMINHIENVAFYANDLFQPTIQADWLAKKYNVLVLDPPRSGAQEIVSKIEQFNVERILYVSCQPSTFVRDCAHLVQEKGYVLEKLGIMDMFPQTKHLETMGLFVRKRGKPNGQSQG